jgi:hypothetical protein
MHIPLQCNVHYSLQITKKKEALGNSHREFIHLCETEITIQVYCIWYSLVRKLRRYAASITSNYFLRIATITRPPFPQICQLIPRII